MNKVEISDLNHLSFHLIYPLEKLSVRILIVRQFLGRNKIPRCGLRTQEGNSLRELIYSLTYTRDI